MKIKKTRNRRVSEHIHTLLARCKVFLGYLLMIPILFYVALFPFETFAQFGLKNTASGVYGPEAVKKDITPAALAGAVMKTILGFVGVFFLVLMVYAGFKWMTARGNEEDVKRSRNIMIHASIGLIITLSAYAITQFTVSEVLKTLTL